jgi:hypothetical protein
MDHETSQRLSRELKQARTRIHELEVLLKLRNEKDNPQYDPDVKYRTTENGIVYTVATGKQVDFFIKMAKEWQDTTDGKFLYTGPRLAVAEYMANKEGLTIYEKN